MPRKTLIFGNGLGMALDPVAFSLEHAIAEVWNAPGVLSEEQKRLISACLEFGVLDEGGPPRGEHQLDRLQQVLAACDFLRSIDIPDEIKDFDHWLSDEGKKFPDTVRYFLHQVGKQFFDVCKLPKAFIDPLCAFVRKDRPNVATLNYDDLLYGPFVDRHLCQGFSGYLVDGLVDAGFKGENLDRRYGRTFGWYLHLHGSPLFYTGFDGRILKFRRDVIDSVGTDQGHIVLTHVSQKPAVIASSGLLRAYWERLDIAMDESNEILLVGYSGADEHLNKLLAAKSSKLHFRVIEWDGAGVFEARSQFWGDKMNSDTVQLVQMPDILEFTNW